MVVTWQDAQSEVHLLQQRLARTEQRLLGQEQWRKVAEERPANWLECKDGLSRHYLYIFMFALIVALNFPGIINCAETKPVMYFYL